MRMKAERISRIAAAVSLALGSTFVLAQESQDPLADEESEQQSSQEQEPRSQEQGFEESADASRSEQESQSSQGQGDLQSVADENPDLSKFVEAVNAAGLSDALTSGTDYTIFAPTNEALEGEDIDSLLEEDGNQELVSLLRAHIVADDVDPEMAGRIGQALTIDGGTIDLSVDGETVMVGDASVEGEPIEMANLRIYTIDEVLPQNPSPQTAADTTQRPDSEPGAFGDPRSDTETEDSEARP